MEPGDQLADVAEVGGAADLVPPPGPACRGGRSPCRRPRRSRRAGGGRRSARRRGPPARSPRSSRWRARLPPGRPRARVRRSSRSSTSDRPQEVRRLGPLRHDVRGLASVDDHAVHLLQRPEVLAQHRQRRVALHDDRRARCARAPGPRTACEARPAVDDAPLLDRQRTRRVVVVRRRVDHHRGVDALERAGEDEVDLAAADLLRRACRGRSAGALPPPRAEPERAPPRPPTPR